MISHVLSAALVAGFVAACVASALQFVWTTPLIVMAERYERHASAAPAAAPAVPLTVLAHLQHAAPKREAPGVEAAEWKPAERFSRFAFTALATLVSGIGYAFLLLALLLATGREAEEATALRWALGGFLAASLAPAVGLPPELPGMGGGGADLAARQLWWACTAAGTGFGLYLLTQARRRIAAVLLGLSAIAAPHLVGAPQAAEVASDVPAALAAQFAARSLAVALLFWATLGLALGWAWERFGRRAALASAA